MFLASIFSVRLVVGRVVLLTLRGSLVGLRGRQILVKFLSSRNVIYVMRASYSNYLNPIAKSNQLAAARSASATTYRGLSRVVIYLTILCAFRGNSYVYGTTNGASVGIRSFVEGYGFLSSLVSAGATFYSLVRNFFTIVQDRATRGYFYGASYGARSGAAAKTRTGQRVANFQFGDYGIGAGIVSRTRRLYDYGGSVYVLFAIYRTIQAGYFYLLNYA